MDINDLLPKNGFNKKSIGIKNTFIYCRSLSGDNFGDKLWNCKGVNWIVDPTGLPFTDNKETVLKTKVPVSWGGTNTSIDNELLITDDMRSDYTAFEVFAHNYDISMGDTCEALGGNHIPMGCDIPSSTIHKMRIRTGSLDTENSDIIIDWGDGEYSKISDGDYDSISTDPVEHECDYIVSHNYLTAIKPESDVNKKSGKFIIKVYGKKYYNICTPPDSNNQEPKFNLICRTLDYDLPIASHINNISGWHRYAIRLLSVHVPDYFGFNKCSNISNLFQRM